MLLAYYCFTNHGILPHRVEALSWAEKRLLLCFMYRELRERSAALKEGEGK